MQPAPGPVPPPSWSKTAVGVLVAKWVCNRCRCLATNSTKLFEVLRTPCGQPGTWRKVCHDAVQVGHARVECRRCGTSRQKYINLCAQRCPIREFHQWGASVPAGTEVYKAWTLAVRAMHQRSRVQGVSAGILSAPTPAVEPAVDAGSAVAEMRNACQRGSGQLRPFRSHLLCKRTAGFRPSCSAPSASTHEHGWLRT